MGTKPEGEPISTADTVEDAEKRKKLGRKNINKKKQKETRNNADVDHQAADGLDESKE